MTKEKTTRFPKHMPNARPVTGSSATWALLAAALAMGPLGCAKVHSRFADDDADQVATDGSADASAVDDGASDGATMHGDAGAGTFDGAVEAGQEAGAVVDACASPEDLAGLAVVAGDFQSVLIDQGLPCFLQAMGGPQFVACIAMGLEEFVSPPCAICIAEQADCLVTMCIGSCLSDSGGAGCTTCVCSAGCVEEFRVCSGVDFGGFGCP